MSVVPPHTHHVESVEKAVLVHSRPLFKRERVLFIFSYVAWQYFLHVDHPSPGQTKREAQGQASYYGKNYVTHDPFVKKIPVVLRASEVYPATYPLTVSALP